MSAHDRPTNPARALFEEAIQFYQTGLLHQAETRVRELLNNTPDHPSGIHLLGVIHLQQGHHASAVELLTRAAALNPRQPDCLNNLANALRAAGRLPEAQRACEAALHLKADFAAAYHTHAVILRAAGNLTQALHSNSQAIRLNPDFAEAFNTHGAILLDSGMPKEAIEYCNRAIELKPNYGEAHNILGVAHKNLGQTEAALAAFRKATLVAPALACAHANLGSLLHELGFPLQALSCCEQAGLLSPLDGDIQANIANILGDLGRYTESESCYRNALNLNPGNATAHSNLLFLLAARPTLSPTAMLAEQCNWDRLHGDRGKTHRCRHTTRSLSTARRLRIGYVSPDFRAHPVGYFIEPLLANHDRSGFEVTCYANHAESQSDNVTDRLRGLAEHWRTVHDLDDATLAQRIHEDGIDILIDLSGHTRGHRLQVFAYKPAPVQASYLGYLASTGLDAIDYWISDAVLHPDDTPELSTERILRLPRCAFCYKSPAGQTPRPRRLGDHAQLTFASFNHLSKLTQETLETWSHVLHELPNSRLLLMDKFMIEPECRQWITQRFQREGITPERLDLRPRAIYTLSRNLCGGRHRVRPVPAHGWNHYRRSHLDGCTSRDAGRPTLCGAHQRKQTDSGWIANDDRSEPAGVPHYRPFARRERRFPQTATHPFATTPDGIGAG